MECPLGRKQAGKVLKLSRSICSLHQSPKNFNWHLHNFLTSTKTGFEVCLTDPALYKRTSDLGTVYACILVKDILACGDPVAVTNMQAQLKAEFEIHDYGEPRVFWGINIHCDHKHGTIHADQHTYICNMVDHFPDLLSGVISTSLNSGTLLTELCNDSKLANQDDYQSLAGSLQCAANCMCCDIACAVHCLSQFLHCPTVTHMAQAQHTLAYLHDTLTYGPTFSASAPLTGWCDAGFSGCLDMCQSTTGYLYMYNGGPISWRSKMQHSVANSTADSDSKITDSFKAGLLKIGLVKF